MVNCSQCKKEIDRVVFCCNSHKNTYHRRMRLINARKIATHTNKEWLDLLIKYPVCVRCGASGKMTKDHIVPIYQGGSDGIDNLQPLCKTCNSAKGPDNTDHRKEYKSSDSNVDELALLLKKRKRSHV